MGQARHNTIATGAGNLVGARTMQQDAFVLERLPREGAALAVVTDGMGGHAEGALASRIAAKAFRDAFATARRHGGELQAGFEEGLVAANRAVEDAQRGRPERHGMGTTLLAAHVSRAGVTWVSVGDSILLLYHTGTLRRLNEDHSLRAVVGPGNARGNMLRSAVTGAAIPLVDCQAEPVSLNAGDRLVLATDGILTLPMDRLATILEIVRKQSAQAATDAILAAVSDAAGPKQDNCTVLVVDADAAEGAVPASRRVMPAVLLAALGLAVAGIVALALIW